MIPKETQEKLEEFFHGNHYFDDGQLSTQIIKGLMPYIEKLEKMNEIMHEALEKCKDDRKLIKDNYAFNGEALVLTEVAGYAREALKQIEELRK